MTNPVRPPKHVGPGHSGINAYQLCIAEALLLGYSIGTGKPIEGLPVQGWRGELKDVYRALISGGKYDVPLASYLRHPLDATQPIKSLVDIVKREHATWRKIELSKRLKAAQTNVTPEQLARALAILEGRTTDDQSKAQPIPASLGQPARPAPSVHQSTGATVHAKATVANPAGASQAPGPKR